MKEIFRGSWIYFVSLVLLVILGVFVQYRKGHPINNFNSLTGEESKFAYLTDNPCSTAIYGDPTIDAATDSWIKMNLNCGNGTSSTNSLRYNALGEAPSFLSVLTLLSKLNNFSYKYNPKNNVLDIGGLKTSSSHQWEIYVNKVLVTTNLNTLRINKKDNVDLKYE